MGPCRQAGADSTRQYPVRQKVQGRCLDGKALHLLGGVSGPEQAAIASEELHGLEETGADGTSCDGEAQRVYEVARPLLLLGGEAAYCFLYRFFRPLGEGREAFDELGEVFADELLAELLLELGFVVVERTAVEIAGGVGNLGGQGDALLQESHDLLKPRHVQLLLRNRA